MKRWRSRRLKPLSQGQRFRWENVEPKNGGGAQYAEHHCYYLTTSLVGPHVVMIGRYGREGAGSNRSMLLTLNHAQRKWKWESIEGPYITEHAAMLKDDFILAYGGRDANNLMQNDVWKLDLALKEWSKLPVVGPSPPERAYCSGDLLESTGDVLVFGGLITESDPRQYTNELWMLDFSKLQWCMPEVKGTPPKRRYGHASCSVGNRVFYYGGKDKDTFHSDVLILEQSVLGYKSFHWVVLDVDGVTPRTGHSLSYISGRLFLFGGFAVDTYVGDVDVFDLKRKVWAGDEGKTDDDILIENKDGLYSAHSMVATSDKLLVFGGRFSDFSSYKELTVVES